MWGEREMSVPRTHAGSPTLVVSPLIAVMDDQAAGSAQLALKATCLHSDIEARKQWTTVASWMSGTLKPAFTVFTDRELARIADQRPFTAAELAEVAGIRRPSVDRYGKELIVLIWAVSLV